MLFGDVQLHKMYGEGVLCFSRNVLLWETVFCSWWSIVWIDSLRLRWGLWLSSLEVYGLEGISSSLRISSLILSRFIRILWTPWMTFRDVMCRMKWG